MQRMNDSGNDQQHGDDGHYPGEAATGTSRSYPARPQVGVGTIVFRDDQVLLIVRATPPRQGEWSIPGGLQQLGETVDAAAAREVMEETGVEIAVLGVAAVIDLIDVDAAGAVRYHYTLIDVAAEWLSGEAVAGSDAAAVAWTPLSDVAALPMWAETKRVIAEATRLRADSSHPCPPHLQR